MLWRMCMKNSATSTIFTDAIPKVSHLLGLILAYKKDYAGAAERFKAYLEFAPEATDAAKVRSLLAEVEKVTAATASTKER